MIETRSSQARSSNSGLFPRTRRSLANTARRLDTRNRVARELSLLSDRALADIGIYRSDINRFAIDASVQPESDALFVALLADLKALLRGRKAVRYATKAAE